MQKGFSLFEVLIALCLASIVIVGIDFSLEKIATHHAKIETANHVILR